MTIKRYMEDMRKLDAKFKNPDGILFSDAMATNTDIWSNNACRGYMLLAAKESGLSVQTAAELLNNLHSLFERVSVDKAAQICEEE